MSEKILAIEDDEYILDIFSEFLESEGYTVLKAFDGIYGVELFNKEIPHLVLLDLKIPGMHGFDVLSHLTKKSPDTPVIVVSGTANINDAIKAIRLGAWDFITKPIFDMRVLGHAIEKALERYKLICENKRYSEHLEELVQERTEELERELKRRQVAEKKLRSSLQEKDVLLKEIHHRVKNNLQVISSLLNLQSGYIDNEPAIQILKESQHRVKSMALIHEKMYKSQDLAKIDFSEYIKNLSSDLFRSYKNNVNDIKLVIDIDKIFLGVDRAIPCGLITNELVTNSLKYAFPTDYSGNYKEIKIMMLKREKSNGKKKESFLFVISDNGVGLPDDFDYKNTESLGLKLVSTLVEQLNGTFTQIAGSGTIFQIEF